LGALSWSLGFLSFLSASVASLMLLLFLLFIFDLLVRGSPHHYVSVWPFGFIYKAGRKPVSREGVFTYFSMYFSGPAKPLLKKTRVGRSAGRFWPR
jgi:hypothetical protein